MKLAIVMFSLGGPDHPDNVQDFLFNLFNDKAIIRLPQPIRRFLARTIAKRRAPIAREIYEQLGGSSPLLANTRAQGAALEALLAEHMPTVTAKSFVAMRYWHPFAPETAGEVRDWNPDGILLLPMYPQFSTTTSGSSIADWQRAARKVGLNVLARTVCCYPEEPGFITTMASAIDKAVGEAGGKEKARVLLSAHGLPERIVEAGDPYQWQVDRTASAIRKALGRGHDAVVCYQSRVGPLKWIGPSTEAEIERAASDGKNIVVAPIAFVSEHSETLVELDIEYKQLADRLGIERYVRVPTVSTSPKFIAGLAGLVAESFQSSGICPADGARLCPQSWKGCPCRGDG